MARLTGVKVMVKAAADCGPISSSKGDTENTWFISATYM